LNFTFTVCALLKIFVRSRRDQEKKCRIGIRQCLSRIYGIRFGEKDRGLSTYKPWTEQAGGLEAFLHRADQNFEVVLKIQDQK
jgi:hypothetical protein